MGDWGLRGGSLWLCSLVVVPVVYFCSAPSQNPDLFLSTNGGKTWRSA